MIGPAPRDGADFLREDATGERFGVPTFFFHGSAPEHLRTVRQLRALGLRPNGQDIAGQLVRLRRHRTPLVAYLYDVEQAAPKRDASPAQLAALAKATQARSERALERNLGADWREKYGDDRTEVPAAERLGYGQVASTAQAWGASFADVARDLGVSTAQAMELAAEYREHQQHTAPRPPSSAPARPVRRREGRSR